MSTLEVLNQDYAYGFTSNIEADTLPKGLNTDIIKAIWQRKHEPEFMLEFRLKAYQQWLDMAPPTWADVDYPEIDYQDLIYYSAPKSVKQKQDEAPQSLDEVDPELLATFAKLGIPLSEQKRLAGVASSNTAVDAVFDSVSIATTFKKDLAKHGVIFCSISEALHDHPELIEKYLGSVVPVTDNYFSALNAAVFTDGSFVYIPPGVKCPMDLSTYFRINTEGTGQFERTLIIADKGSFVNYLEGCTAPKFDSRQLHAAVVELIALEDATINYSTVQNWFAGDPKTGKGGIYNFVTKRGNCLGDRSRISWTQVETGSAITWKYPSCLLTGESSVGEFYSVALTNHHQQADTGTKMIHIGANTKSRIVSKGISAGVSKNSYRGSVVVKPTAKNARNFTQCDSMLMGDRCKANTYPYIQVETASASLEHEATTSRISEEQLFYFTARGIEPEVAVASIVNGFCQEVFNVLPAEFAAEASKLLELKLENSVG